MVNDERFFEQTLIDRLQYSQFFNLFPSDVRATIFGKAIHKSYGAGEIIYNRGDTDAFMGVVISGRLRMSMASTDGRGILVGLVESGEVFGETTLLDGLPRTTDAEAETDCSLMIIKRDTFLTALHASPDAMQGIIQMLCHRLRSYLNTIELIALQNLPKRLARHLLYLATDYGVAENGHITIQAGLNQASLGQQLATSRESINKQLKIFAEQGLIVQKGLDIVLINPDNLRQLAI